MPKAIYRDALDQYQGLIIKVYLSLFCIATVALIAAIFYEKSTIELKWFLGGCDVLLGSIITGHYRGKKLRSNEERKRILFVEDQDSWVLALTLAFQKRSLMYDLNIANTAETATLMLKRQGQFMDYDKPDLVVVDLKLPVQQGEAFINQIKTDFNLCEIPVIILTGTPRNTLPENTAYDFAAAYIEKRSGCIELLLMTLEAIFAGQGQTFEEKLKNLEAEAEKLKKRLKASRDVLTTISVACSTNTLEVTRGAICSKVQDHLKADSEFGGF